MKKRNLTLKDASISFLIAFIASQLMIIFGELILSAILSLFDFSSYEIAHFFEKPIGYLIIALFQFIAFVGVFIFYSKKTTIAENCLKEKPKTLASILFVLAGLATMFLLNYFINYYTLFLNLIDKPTAVISYALDNKSSYFISIISLCLFPAIGEELIFRGIICNTLKTKNNALAICLSSVMFALFHFNLSQLFYPLFFGIILSVAYIYTKNLIVPILIHFVNNFVNITIQYFSESSSFLIGTNNFIGMLILAILWIVLVGILFIALNKKEKQEETNSVENQEQEEQNNKQKAQIKNNTTKSYIANYKAIFKSEKFLFYFPLIFMICIYIIITL